MAGQRGDDGAAPSGAKQLDAKLGVRQAEKAQKKDLKQRMRKYAKDQGDNQVQSRYKVEPDQPGRLKASLKNAKRMKEDAVKSAARAELIHNTQQAGFMQLDEGEEGRDVTQRDILESADVQTKRKRFDVKLDKLGPYRHCYSKNGNMLALGGEKGHLSIFQWKNFKVFGEVQLKDKLHDLTFLHDDQLLATAQRKYVYIYNNKGSEIHLLKNLQNIRSLDFLPHHFLLTAVGTQGVLHYFDVSTGQPVSVQKTKMGPCEVQRKNPWNAVLALGHSLGAVSMWSPTCSAPLVKVLAHSAPIVDIAFPLDGRYMATTAADCSVKVWDTRMWRSLHNIPQRAMPTSLDVSQTGLLSVSAFNKVEVWKDWTGSKPKSPYLVHRQKSNEDTIARTRFCPYEDVLGLGHMNGISSVLVPGAGEANFDYYVANPYETKDQRKERTVHQLLDKLPPAMIMLNPRDIGRVNTAKQREKKDKDALLQRQLKAEEAKGGVADGDAASDDEAELSITRPDFLPTESKKARVRRPKHLKEKKLFLQKQEHQRFQAKREAQKRRRDEAAEGGDGGDGAGAEDTGDADVFDDKASRGPQAGKVSSDPQAATREAVEAGAEPPKKVCSTKK